MPLDRAWNSEQNQWSLTVLRPTLEKLQASEKVKKCEKYLKNDEKREKKNRIFSLFPIPVVFLGLVVERSATTDFAQNFKLYPMALSKTRLNRGFWYLKNTLFLFRYGFLAYYTHEIKWEHSSMQYGLGYQNHQRDNPQCFVRNRKIGSTPVWIIFGATVHNYSKF